MKLSLLLLLLFLVTRLGSQEDTTYGNVFLIYWSPNAVCDFEDPFNSEETFGVLYDMDREVMNELGWVEGVDYNFECITVFDFYERYYSGMYFLWTNWGVMYNNLLEGQILSQVFF